MAASRLEKIGTIVTRTTGLLKSGAMKIEDKPIWYDVVVAFPPKYEPRYDRPAPNMEVRPIFYKEDVIRAKYYNLVKNLPAVNLFDSLNSTNSQRFIAIYKKLESQGALSEEKISETALEMLDEENKKYKIEHGVTELSSPRSEGLVNRFNDAQKVNITELLKK